MLTESIAQTWMDIARGEAAAHGITEVEIWMQHEESSLTRFANNAIHQNVSEESHSISIRVVEGHRTARATTNRTADDSIRETTRTAIALARANEPDRTLLPLLETQAVDPVQRWDQATADLSPQARAEAVGDAIRIVESAGHTAAGIYSCSWSKNILANSRGLFLSHAETGAGFSITATGTDSSGWAKASAVSAASLSPRMLARRASDKASHSARPRRLEAGKYRVLLEPAAVLDLAGQIFADCSATALEEERSFLTGRLTEKIFGDNITIRDDVRHPLQNGAPFDGEGVPRQTLTLFAKGVPGEMPHGRAAAHRAGRAPTGHGFALPNEMGEMPHNIVMEGGADAIDGLFHQLDRGILVTRLWYIRETDPFRKLMTGMTRDGTFLVEDGKIVCGLNNFRFNQSIIDMLQNVEAMSAAERASGEEAFDMVVPAMIVNGFQFSEVTLF